MLILKLLLFFFIITDEYDLGGTVALLLQDHLTTLIVSHVTTIRVRLPKQHSFKLATENEQ